jgi:hypothetical protein
MYLRDSQTVFSAFTGVGAVATLRRKRRTSAVINPKKMYEEVSIEVLQFSNKFYYH